MRLDEVLKVAAEQQLERATRLCGTAAALREAIGAPRAPNEGVDFEHTAGTLRAALREEAFATAWAAGQALPLEEAVALGLADASAPH